MLNIKKTKVFFLLFGALKIVLKKTLKKTAQKYV